MMQRALADTVGIGERPTSSINASRLIVGFALLAAIVCFWIYLASLIDCPNATGYCDGDDRRGAGLGMFYVLMLLGPLGFALVLSAFPPSTNPPIGRNWLLWLVALFSTAASALLNFVVVGFVVFAVGDPRSLSGFAWALGLLSLAGAAANGFAAALTLRLLLPHRLGGSVPSQAPKPTSMDNRIYVRFALGAGGLLLVATATLGGFGFFAALPLIGLAFVLLPKAGSGRA